MEWWRTDEELGIQVCITGISDFQKLSVGDITRLARLEAGSYWGRNLWKRFITHIERGHPRLGLKGDPQLAQKLKKHRLSPNNPLVIELEPEQFMLIRSAFPSLSHEDILQEHAREPFEDIDTLMEIFLIPMEPRARKWTKSDWQRLWMRARVKRVGAELKEKRQRLGLTQCELASLAGLSQATVAKIETLFYNPRGERQFSQWWKKKEKIERVIQALRKAIDASDPSSASTAPPPAPPAASPRKRDTSGPDAGA